jgi:beta-1,4-mannooligosaccharide/beta-1,4-mannosyl-N-acetylglucosamine phosphorylase
MNTLKNSSKIPWQDKPELCTDVLWRYSSNPIINRYDIPSSNSIFNSAIVPFKNGF